MSFAARHNQAKTVGLVIGEAVRKRSEILAATDWVQKFCPLILGLPVGIPNKKGKKALPQGLALRRCPGRNRQDVGQPVRSLGCRDAAARGATASGNDGA